MLESINGLTIATLRQKGIALGKVSEEEIAIDLESGGGEFVGTPTIDFAIRATRPINALTELE